MSISVFAKSRTLLRDARFVSIASAVGGAAASPLSVWSYCAAAKFENRVMYALSGLRFGMRGWFSIPGPDSAPTVCLFVP